jgi:5'-nucleotidase
MRRPLVAILIAALGGVGCAPTPTGTEPELVVISVMGTNDVHGELMPQSNHGGLVTFSGYVAALRDARAKDGAVLLVDAGDMWQGTLESNLTEGATVAEAYNALGYAAATIGNHEFDFGPAGPKAIPEFIDDDPQGALKERASELNFPLLAANLIDTTSDQRVDWDNVLPSTMVTRAGIKIGIVGLVTTSALRTTIASNTIGVHIAPLAEAATTEARALRAAGASLVVVIAHAGSRCEEFTDPLDLSSCEMSGEIMRVANAIPSGLVDHIVAGHVHRGIAHVVNGIAITASYSRTSAFSRVDFTLDRDGNIVDRRIYPPQSNCARAPDEGGRCAYEGDSARERATYEGRVVLPMPAVAAITARASDVVAELQAEKIGVFLETAMTLREQPETVLGNLLTDAVLASNDADISIHNVYGGIRAELPQGDMTFGDVYRVFPFDDRVAIIELSGRDVRKIIANQVHNNGRRAGFSGMRVFVVCNAGKMSIQMIRSDGSEVADTDTLRVVANDFLLLGGDNVLTPVMPEGGFDVPYGTPLVRDTLVEWFKQRGGTMNASEFYDSDNLRWNLPDPLPESCSFSMP